MGNLTSLQRNVANAASCGNICEAPDEHGTVRHQPTLPRHSVRVAQADTFILRNLSKAAVQDDAEAVDRICLQEGGRNVINQCVASSGMAPLHLAAQSGNESAFVALLRHGADIEVRSSVGKRAEEYALMYSRRPIMRLIIQTRSAARAANAKHASIASEISGAFAPTARQTDSAPAKGILKGGADFASTPVPQAMEPAPTQPAGGKQDEVVDSSDIDFMDIPMSGPVGVSVPVARHSVAVSLPSSGQTNNSSRNPMARTLHAPNPTSAPALANPGALEDLEEPDLRGTCWPFPMGNTITASKKMFSRGSAAPIQGAQNLPGPAPTQRKQAVSAGAATQRDSDPRPSTLPPLPAPASRQFGVARGGIMTDPGLGMPPLSPTSNVIDNMADSDIMQRLVRAAVEDDASCIARLCKYDRARAMLNITNHNGVSPLHVAGYHGTSAAMKALVRYGADPHLKSEEGMTAAEYGEQKAQKSVREFYFSLSDSASTSEPIHIGLSAGLNKARRSSLNNGRGGSSDAGLPRAMESSSSVFNPYQPDAAINMTTPYLSGTRALPPRIRSQHDMMVASVAGSRPRASEPGDLLAPLARPGAGRPNAVPRVQPSNGMTLST